MTSRNIASACTPDNVLRRAEPAAVDARRRRSAPRCRRPRAPHVGDEHARRAPDASGIEGRDVLLENIELQRANGSFYDAADVGNEQGRKP